MRTETTWIEFEVWMESISILGYMALDEAEDDEPLNFYDWNGLECGTHIINTKYPSFNEDELFKWETLTEWFNTIDLIQYLVDYAEEKKILYFRTETEYGRIFDVELYINCSKLDQTE